MYIAFRLSLKINIDWLIMYLCICVLSVFLCVSWLNQMSLLFVHILQHCQLQKKKPHTHRECPTIKDVTKDMLYCIVGWWMFRQKYTVGFWLSNFIFQETHTFLKQITSAFTCFTHFCLQTHDNLIMQGGTGAMLLYRVIHTTCRGYVEHKGFY